jgi:hypothetical protein
MYKCLRLPEREEVIILAPGWKGRLPELRGLAACEGLVCQGCLQPVRVKAGRFRRSHFAHKHLKGCSYGRESAEILAARAVLYDWLLDCFHAPEYRVTLEYTLPGGELPRPLDGWVEGPGGPFGWWIVDQGLHYTVRKQLLDAFAPLDGRVHWVLLSENLRLDPHRAERFLLSPTERALLSSSAYDEIGWQARLSGEVVGQSLHYLDAAQARLVSLRSLRCCHPPNVYTGLRAEHPLAQVTAGRHTGEFVHPGEDQKLARSRQTRAEYAAEQQAAEERYQAWFAPAPRPPADGPRENRLPANDTGGVQYACLHCGQVTGEYWMTLVVDGVRRCKCRECLARGLA